MAGVLYVEQGYFSDENYVYTDIFVDWATRIIFVPRVAMTLVQSVPTTIYRLDLNTFRLKLNDLEDDQIGMAYPDTHRHNTTVEVGGVILARVIEIINGYTVTFEDGQYAVNLDGANSNVGDVVNVNQVSVRSANSAGLQDLSTLLASAYQGEVCIDTSNGQSGTSTPLGTRSTPVNNFTDAVTIANRLSIKTLRLLSSTTLGATAQVSGKRIVSDAAAITTATILPDADVTQCTFEDLTVTGTMDGENTFEKCSILDINYVNGFIFQCAINGTITLGGGAQCSILDCWSNVAGGGPGQFARVDMGGSGNSLALRNYSGGINVSNYTGGGAVSMDMASGRVLLEPTVTDGSIFIRGIADVTDNSTGTATVIDQTVNSSLDLMSAEQALARKLLTNRVSISTDNAVTTIYDDDGVTPLWIFDHADERNRVPR